MKKSFLIICAATLSTMTAMAQNNVRPKPGPAPEIKLGKTESFTLDNGMKVFVVENHKLPTIAASIELDIRPELEGDMAGYRDMMSELLTSGTKTRTNDQFNKEIDFIGASINASDEGVDASGLKKHMNKVLELMADVAMNADFKQSELDKIKSRTLSGMEAEENEPDAMLNKVSAVVDFGKKHPYGEVSTKESVNKISLDRVKKYYSSYYRPNVAYMAIVGDVTMEEIKPLIEKYFGNWKKQTVPVATYSNPQPPSATRKVIFASRDAAVQSVVNVTYPIELKPGTPDVIKAKVANSILGGGSNGRLFLNLREKHAWTYGSYSSIIADELKGTFTAYAKARNVVSDSSVGEILAEMKAMRDKQVDKEELQNHIVNMSGAFAIGLENPGTVAQYAINIERYKMPKDYYEKYLKNLAAVTPADVQMVARKYINPDAANIVVVGSQDQVAKTMLKYDSDGKIDYMDTYGNEVKPVQAAAVPAGITGDEVMKRYIAAIGGEKTMRSIKDIKTVSKGEIQGTPLTITEMKKDGGKLKVLVTAMGMTMQKIVVNGGKGYTEAQGQKKDMEGEDLADALEQADLYAELNAAKYGLKYDLKGMDKVNGADAYKIEVTNKAGKKTIQLHDATSYLLVKKIETEEAEGEATTMATEYSDYKEVPGSGGYKIPYTIKIPLGPGMSISANVETAEVNKNIADTEFE
jgi:zinc protease